MGTLGKKRKRPKGHVRKLKDKFVAVNAGLVYQDEQKVRRNDLTVQHISDAVKCLATDDELSKEVNFGPASKENFAWFKDGDLEVMSRIKPRYNFFKYDERRSGRDTVPSWGQYFHRIKFLKGRPQGIKIVDSVFEDCHFEGSLLGKTDFDNVIFYNSFFDGAEMQTTHFSNVRFSQCDVTGADFFAAKIEGDVDITDSNFSREQVEQLLRGVDLERYAPGVDYSSERPPKSPIFWYRRYTPEMISELHGLDAEEAKLLMWLNQIECRDNQTYERVDVSDFDPSVHHVPQWEMDLFVSG